MSHWEAPHLVAFAAAPGAALLVLAIALLLWRRRIDAVSAVSLSLGLALVVALLASLAVHTSSALYELRGSFTALLAIPLVSYAATLAWLTVRWRIKLPLVLASGAVGLLGFYYLGGVVLISSACGISLGGC